MGKCTRPNVSPPAPWPACSFWARAGAAKSASPHHSTVAARSTLNRMSHIALVALMVGDYDTAIRFFVDVLQFELVEDSPSVTNDGRPKRWVVVRPRGTSPGPPGNTASSPR